MAEEKTTVTVTDETWRRLMLRKGRGDSFDDVISELLDTVEEYEEEHDED
jgi:predicted CopG family antitoxin